MKLPMPMILFIVRLQAGNRARSSTLRDKCKDAAADSICSQSLGTEATSPAEHVDEVLQSQQPQVQRSDEWLERRVGVDNTDVVIGDSSSQTPSADLEITQEEQDAHHVSRVQKHQNRCEGEQRRRGDRARDPTVIHCF